MLGMFNNVDHGALPGCFDQVKEKFHIDNLRFGILGSMVFAGLTIGSPVVAGVFSKGEWIKSALVAAVLCNAVCLYLFTTTSNFWVILFLRGLTGFF